MNDRTVLISGAGIAGPALAFWLARHGFQPTVVERASALRSSGSPVDVRGSARDVAERMGIVGRLREARTSVKEVRFVDGAGRPIGRIDADAWARAGGRDDIELPRGDLAAILHEASREVAEFVFGDGITELSPDEAGVNVRFERQKPRRFGLVVGADGLHSTVRRLAFGVESGFVAPLGLFIATMPVAGLLNDERAVVMYNTPGCALALHPSRGQALAAFMFRGPADTRFDPRDMDQHKRIVAAAYAGAEWIVPELLPRLLAARDLYFDSISRVNVPSWSIGRVALVGDAATSVSLFGDGASLAIEGAFTLASELGASPHDLTGAFRRYEAKHRKRVEPKQKHVARGAALLIPATRTGIRARNLAVQLWPLATAAATLGRRWRARRMIG